MIFLIVDLFRFNNPQYNNKIKINSMSRNDVRIQKNISKSFNFRQSNGVITQNTKYQQQLQQKDTEQFRTLFPQLKSKRNNKISLKQTDQMPRDTKVKNQRYTNQTTLDLIDLKQYKQNLKKFQYYKYKFNGDHSPEITKQTQLKNPFNVKPNNSIKQKKNKKLYFSQFSNRQHTKRPLTNQKYVQTLQKCFKNKSYANKISKTPLFKNKNQSYYQNFQNNNLCTKSFDHKTQQNYLQYMIQKIGNKDKPSSISKRKIQQSKRATHMLQNLEMITKQQNLKRPKINQGLQPWMFSAEQNPQFQY